MATPHILITYGSLYGYTEQYARWIEQALTQAGASATLIPTGNLTAKHLAGVDAVVAGLSDYGGFLTGSGDLKKLGSELGALPLYLFSVSFSGLAGASEQKLDSILAKNLGAGLLEHASATCHVRGGLDHTRLSLKHRTAMVGIRTAIAALPKKNEANQQMLESFTRKTVDYSSPEQIQPLIDAALAQVQPA